MEDPVTAMLAYAAAVPGPFRLRIRDQDGQVTDQEISTPYAIIGRGEGCHVQLNAPSVSFRHAYLQAIGSRVACVDLLSSGGIRELGAPFRGWLSPQHILQIGPYQIQLMGKKWLDDDETLKAPLDFRPRDEQRPEYGVLPEVNLELLNTQHRGQKWPINRVITLIGRDDRCRITVADDRLSRVQCALLLLPSGLWAIDLLGTGGIQLNGEDCNCALMTTGAELSIGPYRLTAHYPEMAAPPMSTPAAIPSIDAEFLTRTHRILPTEFYHDTLIVAPVGDLHSVFFQDMRLEATRVVDLITQRGFQHVLVDFSRTEAVGYLVLEGLSSICRAAPEKSALCSANSSIYAALQTSQLSRLYDHYHTRQDALQAIYLPQ